MQPQRLCTTGKTFSAGRWNKLTVWLVDAALKRELTADSAFMGEVRRKEKVRTANARDVKAKRAIAFLEQQESDFKSGGQSGMNPHKKKKK